jgi:hypothetical protein
MKISIGRIVHYVLPNGKHRPAIIVETWGNETTTEHIAVQLQVFIDGTNDLIGNTGAYGEISQEEAKAGVAWRTSVEYASESRACSWHWPERTEE